MAESGSPAPPAVFSVWAPRPDRVRLDVDGALYPMDPADDGWWRTDVDARPDARYGFVLDDDPKVLPDPRSPRQPDGVHERSQLWQPAPDAWTDDDWQGRSLPPLGCLRRTRFARLALPAPGIGSPRSGL